MKENIYTLGINDGHLATAALARNGEIIACVSEERFTRIKNQNGLPVKSIKFCLDLAKIKPQEVNLITVGGKLVPPTNISGGQRSIFTSIYGVLRFPLYLSRKLSLHFTFLRDLEDLLYGIAVDFSVDYIDSKRKANLLKNFPFIKDRVVFLDHHLTHAYTAIFASPFAGSKKTIVIITCDGEGDKLSATVNTFKNGILKNYSKTSMTNSLGNLYRGVTEYLGMKALEHEYKVMGLAAYVSPSDKKANELYEKIKDLVNVDKKNLKIVTRINSQLFKIGYLDNIFKKYRFDHTSFAVQKLTENVLVDLATSSLSKFKAKELALSGGVFMNVKANQKISEIKELKNIFIMPSCGDESNAIGAAYYGYNKITKKIPSPLTNLYLGKSFNDSEINKVLSKKQNKNWVTTKPKNINKKVANLLASGQIVARFEGRGEWGARALGNRSILANPNNLEAVEIINKMIKSRDFWMPFAPVVLDNHSKNYLKNPKNLTAPFMIITLETTIKGREKLKAALHQYDKTARPQVLTREDNTNYYEIIKEFGNITNTYGLLNTSFNLHGEPIVGSPEDALYVFSNSGLKYLTLGNFLITKVKVIEKVNSA